MDWLIKVQNTERPIDFRVELFIPTYLHDMGLCLGQMQIEGGKKRNKIT